MFSEISLNILDIVQNSVSARASLIEITVNISNAQDSLSIIIKDNGCGMNESELLKAVDPFYTTGNKKSVGLGVPFFKMAAQLSGGRFEINSEKGKGTEVKAVFVLSSIDRMPLGDMTETIMSVITANRNTDIVYSYSVDENGFVFDTRQIRKIFGDIPCDILEVNDFIQSFLNENTAELNSGANY